MTLPDLIPGSTQALRRLNRIRRAAVRALIAVAVVIGIPVAAATSASAAEVPLTLIGSSPTPGASVQQLDRVQLRFNEAVEPDSVSVKLATIDRQTVSTGTPVVTDSTVVDVPVTAPASGVVVMTWAATATGSDKASTGAISYEVGEVPAAALDVAAVTSAVRGAEFARTIMIVAGLTVAIAAIAVGVRAIRRRRGSPSPSPVPWRAVIAAGASAITLGGLLGLFMVLKGAALTTGGGPISAITTLPFGIWTVIAIVFGLVLTFAAVQPWIRRRGLLAAVALGAGALVIVGGVAQAVPPAVPEGDSEQRLPIGNNLQLNAVVSPAAVGRNTITVGVSGPPEATAPATDVPPALLLRPLDRQTAQMWVPLTAQPDGGFSADSVLLPTAGRWRGELVGSTGVPTDSPAVFDFNVQPNPRLTNG